MSFLPEEGVFCYRIGGLSFYIKNINFSGEISSPSDEDSDFVARYGDERNEIFVYLSVSHPCDIRRFDLKKIFTQHRMVFYASANGYFQMFYKTEHLIDKIWDLVVNFDFSHFQYYVRANSGEEINPCRLATSIFLLQHSFIARNGLIIHAAGGSIQGKGIVFAAPSGIGKSTLSRLLSFSPSNRFFSEDRLIVRSADDVWHVWGTPWPGSGGFVRNESAPLSALIFLSQAAETTVSRLSAAAGLRRLLQVVSIPWHSQEWAGKGIAVCESLVQAVPMFELAFRPDQTAVQAVERLAAALP